MRWRRPLFAGAAASFAGLAYLWFAMLSPFGYTPPDGLPPVDDARPHLVFVYGTLRYRPIRWIVMGRAGEAAPASLTGFRREGLDIAPSPGDTVEGRVVEVNGEELRRLDRYERLGIRYDRVRIRIDDGRHAWVYTRIHD